MAGNLKDFATGIVTVAPSPADSGTELTLQSGEGARMPAVPFYATAHSVYDMPTLDNAEKILVTDVTGDVLTIERAQGETTAKNIAETWVISNSIFLDDIKQTLFVQDTQPTMDPGSLWIETEAGEVKTFWVEV